MARRRKATHLKLIAGTRQPCRDAPELLDAPAAMQQIPDAPEWLPNAHAINEWRRVAPILVANRMLTDAGLTVLGQYCALHGRIVELYAAKMNPTGHLLAQFRQMSGQLGLTNVKSTPAKPIGQENPSN